MSTHVGFKITAALVGAFLVAVAAQVALPVPGTPIPFTLQPLAVLLVGGLLGPRYGALSMAMYLAMGAAGLPVFAPGPLPGLARLLGPSGGFLLSFPPAAALVGLLARGSWGLDPHGAPPPLAAVLVATVLGMALMHAGGLAQFTIMTGSAGEAVTRGMMPFLAADLVKAVLAAFVIRRLIQTTRALT